MPVPSRPPRTLPASALFAALAVGAFAAPAARAQHDFGRESIPMRWIEPLMIEDLPPVKFPAYYDDFDKARAHVHTGRFKLALASLVKVTDPKPEQFVQIALIKGKSQGALGRTEEALKTLTDPTQVQVKGKPDTTIAQHPKVQLLRAEVLADAGRTDEALAVLKEHLAADPDSWGGHYLLGAVSEQIGDTETARKAYAWFVEGPQQLWEKWTSRRRTPEFDNAELITVMGRSVDRWATLNMKYAGNNALPNTILNTFIKARQIDPEYWPANVAAAEYFLNHDDRQQAMGELKAALVGDSLGGNPNDITALRLVGQTALDTFDFDRCDAVVTTIRKVNPNSPVADLLEGRNLLLQRRPKDAESPIRRVLAAQPRSIEAMGLLAAVHALQLEEDKAMAILQQVDSIDVGNDNASAYFEVAEQLSAMRQYPRAAAKYKVALERAPWWTAVHNGLGLLYMQSGDEEEGYVVLDGARKLDPFNLATTNYMRLLDDMQQFAKVETPHFIVRFDGKKDPLIGEYFGEFLESIHQEVAGNYKTDPSRGGDAKHKTMIEVFPGHDAFSVRTTGSPWIGTVGASTGRVIAMVTPGDKQMGTYNWSQVLRHEYTHTVTLAATDNRIQHWMTEGLAVVEERAPMRWEWVPMLYQAVKKKELFTMDNLTWGFVRPKRPIDRQLAYAQSAWICKYLEETYGHEAILKMLEMFRNAGRQEDVFPAVTGKPMDQFYKEFLAWCDKQVEGWGYDKETSEKVKKLREEADAARDAKDYDKAIEVWNKVVKLRPVDAMPRQRLAGLHLAKKEPAKALEHLQVLHKVEDKDNRYAKQIARIYRSQKNWDEAAEWGLQSIYVNPYDKLAHQLLLDIYENNGNTKGAEREERVIVMIENWEEARRKEASLKPGDQE
jgi:tetratricopeptide (TPR) repeat protein